ncbi:MAG: S41 family peptidase, partial [Planctomycetota bacterium]|nr:S41 family peptidase [Planctomycetota bacterium]
MTQFLSSPFLLNFLILSALVFSASTAQAEETKDWMRYPAISPDGQSIAFSFKGDLWIVPISGGQAKLLTSHEGYEKQPVWAPDSKSLAFASDRHGNFDIFTISRDGGNVKRLTFHSSDDIPNSYVRDGSAVLFSSTRLDAHDAVLPTTRMSELYQIPVNGGPAKQVFSTPAERSVISPDGKLLAYHDFKGYENAWRKHHISSVARDIWIYDFKTKKHKKWTGFRGEDRNPVWNPTGTGLYYLSEKSGSFNVWYRALDAKKSEAKAISQHSKHPVRFLSISGNGTLVYGFNGQIWRSDKNGTAKQLTIQLTIDQRSNPAKNIVFSSGATEFKVSPDGREIAFIVRGEVFVCSVKSGQTKQITTTPEQERSLSWSPDGKSLYYAAERPQSWNIYRSRLAREDDKLFSRATILKEEKVMVSGDVSFQPVVSPDGKLLAYLQNRDAIHVLNLETGWSRALVPARRNYSYSDGDIQFHWSPDSQWLAFTYLAHSRWLEDIGVAKVKTGKIFNVSNSGYYEGNPVWGPDGHSLLFKSNRYGRKNHGSWGSDVDIMAWYLTDKAHESAMLSFDDWSFRNSEEKDKKDKDEKDKDEKSEASAKKDKASKNAKAKKDAKHKEDKPQVKIQWKGQEDRFRRMTLHSTDIGNYVLSGDGEYLIYFARVEKSWDLWLCHRRKSMTKKYLSLGDRSGGDLQWTKDGKTLFVFRGNGRIEKLSIGGSFKGSPKRTPVSYKAQMTIDSVAEREYLFDHVWRQVKAKFYDPKLHGVPWTALRENYRGFLPTINNNHDFAELLSELLGELNASHTGSGYRFHGKGVQTASLGFIYDQGFAGPGLKIAEVIAKGPADKEESKIKRGDRITHINGQNLGPDINPNSLLSNQVGKRVRITVSRGKKRWEEVIKAGSLRSESQLLYKRWIQKRRELVNTLSKGQIGYTHARSMGDSSFREVYRETLGLNSDKKALIVDTRFNGGGWLHEDLVSFLSGREYLYFVPRGKKFGQLGAEPFTRWTRPVVVIQSEGNYSDAHIFPFAFKSLKIGKLVGTPVAGTGTAVWWET